MLENFMNAEQLNLIQLMAMRKEEGQFFTELIARLEKRVEEIPLLHSTDKIKDVTVHLHYFVGNMDWWIIERDSEAEQQQAFGYANIGYGPELGYISIHELINTKMQGGAIVELDLYFNPKPIFQIKERIGL